MSDKPVTTPDELRRLLAEATPGEWRKMKDARVYAPWLGDGLPYVGTVADCYSDADAALIVALRNHADALLDVVEEAQALLDVLPDVAYVNGTRVGQQLQALDAALARLDPKETP